MFSLIKQKRIKYTTSLSVEFLVFIYIFFNHHYYLSDFLCICVFCWLELKHSFIF